VWKSKRRASSLKGEQNVVFQSDKPITEKPAMSSQLDLEEARKVRGAFSEQDSKKELDVGKKKRKQRDRV